MLNKEDFQVHKELKRIELGEEPDTEFFKSRILKFLLNNISKCSRWSLFLVHGCFS